MADNIRIGKVSSIDYANGMVKVVYNDKGKTVTAAMPVINNRNEYCMPGVGDTVLVNHLSNGTSRGVVVGTLWNKGNVPPENGGAIYRKDLSKAKGEALMRYHNTDKELLIKAPEIVLQDADNTTTLAQILARLDALDGGGQ